MGPGRYPRCAAHGWINPCTPHAPLCADIFFYAFLPPLLTDAAMRLDFYIFKKIWPHIVLMAYVMVRLSPWIQATPPSCSVLLPLCLLGPCQG